MKLALICSTIITAVTPAIAAGPVHPVRQPNASANRLSADCLSAYRENKAEIDSYTAVVDADNAFYVTLAPLRTCKAKTAKDAKMNAMAAEIAIRAADMHQAAVEVQRLSRKHADDEEQARLYAENHSDCSAYTEEANRHACQIAEGARREIEDKYTALNGGVPLPQVEAKAGPGYYEMKSWEARQDLNNAAADLSRCLHNRYSPC